MRLPVLLFFLLAFAQIGHAQRYQPGQRQETRLLFIMDASKSMLGRWESGSKMDVARKLMLQFMDSLQSLPQKDFQLALRVYGHQSPVPPQNCNDTRLEIPFSDNNIGRIKKTIRGLRPLGTTPIARSITQAGGDFPDACPACRNIIILLTDGIEACDEDPCEAARVLREKGVILKPFIIGVGIAPEDKSSLECIGNYYDASDPATFKKALNMVVAQAFNSTTAQLSLLDHRQEATETNVPVTFYDKKSGRARLQFVHTLNRRNRPDTIYLDPLVNYRLTVHAIPEQHLDSIKIETGKHNVIVVPVPRGKLRVDSRGLSQIEHPLVVVREAGQQRILNVQTFGEELRYVQGAYELEILTLPRIYRKVIIKGQETTAIDVTTPGIVNIQSSVAGYGSLLQRQGENSWTWLIDLNPEETRQRFILQPGEYALAYRSRHAQSSSYSKIRTFSIESGVNTQVHLN